MTLRHWTSSWRAIVAKIHKVSASTRVTFADVISWAKDLVSTGAVVALFLYLANLYRNRVRVRVRILAERFYNPDKPPAVEFEVENVGLTATSIEPIVPFKGFLPRPTGKKEQDAKFRLEPYELVFQFDGTNRTLEPFKPVRFEAKNDRVSREISAKLGFMFFKIYTFCFTRGGCRRAYILSAGSVPLSWSRYWSKRLDFKIRGVRSLPKPKEPAYLDD
jgi:hypothetical protein